MKSHGSARALLPASASFSARMSPTSGTKRRSSTDKLHAAAGAGHSSSSRSVSPPQDAFPLGVDAMANAAAMPGEYLFQLQLQHQQLQHQQQQLAQQHQHGMAVAAAYGYSSGGIHQPMAPPPFAAAPYLAMARVPSSAPLMMAPMVEDASTRSFGALNVAPAPAPAPAGDGDEDAASLLQRLEKKEQMITQLGSFLSQMKQESEGTAATWKEKLQEIAELKRQLAATAQQLESARASEQNAAAELARARQELDAALAALQEREQTHVDELTVMHDEITRRQSEAEHMKVGYDQSLKDVSLELLQAQQDAGSRRLELEDALRRMEDGHRLTLAQLDDERAETKRGLEQLAEQLDAADREKQELGQHLWNVTQELQLGRQREEELERRCAAAASDTEKTQSAWSERFQHFQSERAEQLGVHSLLQTQLQELDAKLQSERSQKEELNALMGRELQRFHDEAERLQQTHGAALAHEAEETERWRLQAAELQDKLVRAESDVAQTSAELDQLHARLESIGQENQHLQQNGSEKASTLQELNNQLGGVLAELQDVQSRYEHLHARWERHQSGLLKCLQLLPPSAASKELESDAVPARIASALEELAQLSAAADEMKIAELRARQELDGERERGRLREYELLQQSQALHAELETTRADAKTLAHELQQLSRQSGGAESKLAAQVQQLAKELEDARVAGGLQVLQLQKALESQRLRTGQLESEKRELLQEAEQLNASVESVYQARRETQAELDQLRATWKELQLEHADLKESYDDLDAHTARTIGDLNARLAELQSQQQAHRSESGALRAEQSRLQEQLGRLQADFEASSHRFLAEQAQWLEKERELGAALEDKTRRMGEMLEVLTQLQSKAELLDKARASEDQSARAELERCQQQLLAVAQEKKRFEVAYSGLKAHHEQAAQNALHLKEERRHLAQQQSEADEELEALRNERARLQSELERVARAKSSLQAELHRVTDEAQDVARQLEVVRRDARAQEARSQDDAERLRKELDELRVESSEANALADELQAKLTSIQTAANATINDLMTELQSAQEAIAYERARLQKESEQLRTQLLALDADLRRRESDAKELHAALRQEKGQLADRESELALKLSRASTALEQKRQETDKLGKELEAKALKVAEYERKLAPLASAKESLQTKNAELKQSLDAKAREAHELEGRLRDDLARAAKDKREVEALYATLKEDYEAVRSQTSGQQQQWQSECRAAKQSLERTKSELGKASAEALALTQRLEACQRAANETISELSARLEAAEQQKEMALGGLQRELGLERERRRETEVQKMELQRLLRQQQVPPPEKGAGSAGDRSTAWVGDCEPNSSTAKAATHPSNSTLSSSAPASTPKAKAPEIRKFYANEPLTNAELSSLPMALITAQIGLDLAGNASPTKSATRARFQQQQQQENNDDIPLLPLEKLPQNPEADGSSEASSPTCDTSGGRSSRHQLAALSARSSERFFTAKSSGNNSKKQPPPSGKKKRLPSSAALTAAYASFSALPSSSAKAPAGSPLGVSKSKSTSKLLPRIL